VVTSPSRQIAYWHDGIEPVSELVSEQIPACLGRALPSGLRFRAARFFYVVARRRGANHVPLIITARYRSDLLPILLPLNPLMQDRAHLWTLCT
jgi:hypothetical protein